MFNRHSQVEPECLLDYRVDAPLETARCLWSACDQVAEQVLATLEFRKRAVVCSPESFMRVSSSLPAGWVPEPVF